MSLSDFCTRSKIEGTRVNSNDLLNWDVFEVFR